MSCVKYREAGFSDSKGKSGQIKIVDPNCLDVEGGLGQSDRFSVNHEDLTIFVGLKAKTKGKSVLTNNISDDTFDTSESTNTVSFDFLTPRNKDGSNKTHLTTDWTEIGGMFDDSNLGTDYESFGITNIDIDVNASHIPQITIDFTDIRGATLFEQGSCSKYGVFFHLPYPLFELTVKGYYGQPVKWYLNLVKFNTKFNSETGNFDSKAEFIGWSYAFLADMLMGYGMAAPYMEKFGAKQKLQATYRNTQNYYRSLHGGEESEEYQTFINSTTISDGVSDATGGNETIFCRNGECLTIIKLLQRVKSLEKNLKEVGKTKELERVTKLLTLKETLNRLKNTIVDFRRVMVNTYGWKSSHINIGDEYGDKTSQQKYVVVETNKSIETETSDYIKTFFGPEGTILNLVKQIKQFEVEDKPKEIGNNVLVGDLVLDGDEENGKLFTDSEDGEDDALGTIGVNTLFQSGVLDNIGNYVNSDFTKFDKYIAVGMIQQVVDAQINSMTEKINAEKEKIGDVVNTKVREALGFVPTIKNIFIILSCNIELFNQLLLEATIDAENYHNLNDNTNGEITEEAKEYVVSNTKKLWPWPTYVEKSDGDEKGSLETYPGKTNSAWPEVVFVEDFIDSMLRLRKDIDALSDDFSGKPGFDNYAPINPIETPLNAEGLPLKYKGADESPEGMDKIFRTIGERGLIALDYTFFNPLYLSEESLDIPSYSNVDDDSWNPLARDVEKTKKFANKMGRFDAYNLVNSIENSDTLQVLQSIAKGTDEDFRNKVLGALNKKGDSTRVSYSILNTNSLTNTNKFTEKTNINNSTVFYSYKPTSGSIIMGDESGVFNSLNVYPNPNKTPKDEIKNVFRIFDADDIRSSRGINISSDEQGTKFQGKLDEHLKTINAELTQNKEYRAIVVDLKNSSELQLDGSQKTPIFSGDRLFVALKPGGNKKRDDDDDANRDATDGTVPKFTDGFSNIRSGDLLYPNFIERSGNPDGFNTTIHSSGNVVPTYGGPPIQFFDNYETKKYPWTSDVGDEPFDYLENLYDGDVEVMNTLVQLPIWLDNVNKFRVTMGQPKLKGFDGTVDESIETERFNLAYLFLDSLMCSPLISGDNVVNGKKFSKALTSFNVMGSYVKVPKAWLLSFGAKLWRYKSFVGTKSDGTWNKVSEGETPNGFDTLSQPGYPITSTSSTYFDDSYKNDGRTNQNMDSYLMNNMLFSGVTNANFQKSTFSEDILKTERNIPSGLGDDVDWDEIDGAYFDYYGFYSKGRVGNNDEFAVTDGSLPVGINFNVTENDELVTLGLVGKGQSKEPFDTLTREVLETYEDGITNTVNESTFLENSTWKVKWLAPWEWGFYMEPTSSKFFGLSITEDLKAQYQTFPTYLSGSFYEYTSFLPKEYKYEAVFNTSGGNPPVKQTKTISGKDTGSFGWVMERLPDLVKDVIIDKFKQWATEGDNFPLLIQELDPINFGEGANLSSSYEVKDSSPPLPFSQGEHGQNRLIPNDTLTKLIKNLLSEKYTVMNATPKIWWATKETDINEKYRDSFNVREDYIDEYMVGLREELDEALKTKLEAVDDENSKLKENLGSLLGDDDVKLSLYRSFKSLSDKWISANSSGDNINGESRQLFFNIKDKTCMKNKNDIDRSTLPLAAHFSFVNRTMGDIGDKAIIDISVLRDVVENPTMSFYQLIDRVMKQNHFNFFPLPSFSNFSNSNVFPTGTDDEALAKQLKSMFEPSPHGVCVESGPQFVCMYVGGSSRILDFNTNSNCGIDKAELNNVNDSIKLINSEGDLNNEWAESDFNSPDASVSLFRVAYGNENQSHFKSIQLDQSEFTETQESLMIIDTLAKGGDSAKTTTKGQNLHNLYLTRSYKCTVESMGNMMIQPMTYFQLDNVPMFNGLYMILQVKHTVQANSVSTTFTGVRQPISTVPLVKNAITAMNIDLGDLVDGIDKDERGTTTLAGISGDGVVRDGGEGDTDTSDPYDSGEFNPPPTGDDTLFEFEQIDV